MSIKPGDIVHVFSYKHDGKLHRVWKKVQVLDSNDKYLIVGNNKTRVIESDGRNWITREPSIYYFFKDYWFNVIGMIKSDGIHYYCNLSSPYIYDDEAIKYIDYDLDVKIYPNHTFNILDRDEYNHHKKYMNYPKKLCDVIENQLNILLDMIKKNQDPFNDDAIYHWYNIYTKIEK